MTNDESWNDETRAEAFRFVSSFEVSSFVIRKVSSGPTMAAPTARKLFLVLCGNAVLLGLILMSTWSRGSAAAAALADGPPPAVSAPVPPAGGLTVVPAQFSATTFGCYLLDSGRGSLCVYTFHPGEHDLHLEAARDLQFDRQARPSKPREPTAAPADAPRADAPQADPPPATMPATATAARGLTVVPAQFSSTTCGCYLLDAGHESLCVYTFLPGEHNLHLEAARDVQYDRQLKQYNTSPPPTQVQRLADRAAQPSRTVAPLVAPRPDADDVPPGGGTDRAGNGF
jgi:hypothetical protein